MTITDGDGASVVSGGNGLRIQRQSVDCFHSSLDISVTINMRLDPTSNAIISFHRIIVHRHSVV